LLRPRIQAYLDVCPPSFVINDSSVHLSAAESQIFSTLVVARGRPVGRTSPAAGLDTETTVISSLVFRIRRKAASAAPEEARRCKGSHDWGCIETIMLEGEVFYRLNTRSVLLVMPKNDSLPPR